MAARYPNPPRYYNPNENPHYYTSGHDPNPNNHVMWAYPIEDNVIHVRNMPLDFTEQKMKEALYNDPNIINCSTNVLHTDIGVTAHAYVKFHTALAARRAVSRLNGTQLPYIFITGKNLAETESQVAAYFDAYGSVESVKLLKTTEGIHVTPIQGIVIFRDLEGAVLASLDSWNRRGQPIRFKSYGPYQEDMAEVHALEVELDMQGPTLEEPLK